MAGTLSQGICFPLNILPEKKNGEYEVNEDVTEILGVTQYEPTMDKESTTDTETSKKHRYPKWLMRFKWFRNLVVPNIILSFSSNNKCIPKRNNSLIIYDMERISKSI